MTERPAPAIVFADPPPIERPPNNLDAFWAEVAETARTRPGVWVSVGRHPSSQVSRVKRGQIASLRPEFDWEVVGRKIDSHGHIDVYVRFLGSADEEAAS